MDSLGWYSVGLALRLARESRCRCGEGGQEPVHPGSGRSPAAGSGLLVLEPAFWGVPEATPACGMQGSVQMLDLLSRVHLPVVLDLSFRSLLESMFPSTHLGPTLQEKQINFFLLDKFDIV